MASTDAKPIPVKNVAYRVCFPIMDADGDLVTGATGLDSEISKDQGTFTDCTNEATEIATSSGMYYLDLSSTEMNCDCVIVIVKTTSSGAKTTPIILYPQEAGDIKVDIETIKGQAVTCGAGVTVLASVGTAATSTAQTGDSFARLGAPAGASVSADVAAVKAVLPSALTANGNIKASLVELITTALTETATGRIEAAFKLFFDVASSVLTTASINQTGDNFARLGAPVGASISADVAATKALLPSALVGGKIDAHVNDIAANAITATAINADAITAAKIADGAIDIATFAADCKTGSNLNAQVKAIDAGAITAAAIATGAIDADAIADDAIDAGAVKADAITKIQNGLATTANVSAVETDTQDIQSRLPAALTANGNIKSSLMEILTTALTETTGYIATGFKKFFNVSATPVSTMDALNLVATATNLTNAPTNGDLTATMKASVNTEADTAISDAALATAASIAALNDLSAAEVNAEVDAALDTAIPGTPTANSINERVKAIDDKLPSKSYLTGSGNSDGDIEMNDSTGDFNSTQIARINTEADTALSDIDLDHLSKTGSAPTPTIGSNLDKVMNKNGSQTFAQSSDSLEAIADASTTPPTPGDIADAVWDESLSGHTGSNTFGEQLVSLRFPDGVVYHDGTTGEAGTAYPLGTATYPVDNLPDAILIANANNLNIISTAYVGDETIPTINQLGHKTLRARVKNFQANVTVSASQGEVVFEGQILDLGGEMVNCQFEDCYIHSGGIFTNCFCNNLFTNETGLFFNIKNGDSFRYCSFGKSKLATLGVQFDDVTVDDTGEFSIDKCSGHIRVQTLKGHMLITDFQGKIELRSGIDAGAVIQIKGGAGEIINLSPATVVIEGFYETTSIPTSDEIADKVWDELLAGHVASGSAGEAENKIASIKTQTDKMEFTEGNIDCNLMAIATWDDETPTYLHDALRSTDGVSMIQADIWGMSGVGGDEKFVLASEKYAIDYNFSTYSKAVMLFYNQDRPFSGNPYAWAYVYTSAGGKPSNTGEIALRDRVKLWSSGAPV